MGFLRYNVRDKRPFLDLPRIIGYFTEIATQNSHICKSPDREKMSSLDKKVLDT